MQDSGLGSFGSESDTSPIICRNMLEPEVVAEQQKQSKMNSEVGGQGRDDSSEARQPVRTNFTVLYLGFSVLDRRYTQPMLHWVMAEVRRRHHAKEVTLEVMAETLKATEGDSVLLEHKLQNLSRFVRAQEDHHTFAYLTRTKTEDPFTCHVFQTIDEDMVSLFLCLYIIY